MQILVVDDDRDLLLLLTTFLSREGYEVVVADSGEAALAIMQKPNPPALLVIDYMMPGMDGIEFVRRLTTECANCPADFMYVIMLTGAGERVLHNALNAGVDDFLTKPFNPQEFRERIAVGATYVELKNNIRAHVRDLEARLSATIERSGLGEQEIAAG
jgi:DNA-binding response OmpR family regulator